MVADSCCRSIAPFISTIILGALHSTIWSVSITFFYVTLFQYDTITKFIKEYNKDGKYEMILSNTSSDNVLWASKGYDITAEVTRLLNERCEKK